MSVDGIALLRVITIVYAAVLVLALAVVLSVIAIYLWRIAATLRRVGRALAEVRDRTAPLGQHLEGVEKLTEARVSGFERVTSLIESSVGIYDKANAFEEAAAHL